MTAGCGDPPLDEIEDCHNFALQLAGAQFMDVGDAPDREGLKPMTVEAWIRGAPPNPVTRELEPRQLGGLCAFTPLFAGWLT